MKKYHNWSVSGSFEQSLAASRKAFLGRQNYIRIRKKKLTPRTVVYPQRNEVIHNVTKEVLPLLPKVIVEDKSLLEPYCETIQGKIFNDATKYVTEATKDVAEEPKDVAEATKDITEATKDIVTDVTDPGDPDQGPPGLSSRKGMVNLEAEGMICPIPSKLYDACDRMLIHQTKKTGVSVCLFGSFQEKHVQDWHEVPFRKNMGPLIEDEVNYEALINDHQLYPKLIRTEPEDHSYSRR